MSIAGITGPPSAAVSGFDAVPCTNPLEAWYSRKPNDNGKYPLTFRMRDGWADRPCDVPCGKCAGCVADKCSAWGVRCYHESLQHEQNSFVTLTYDDAHCPDSLRVDDLQKFFKRMRRRGVKFRYFGVGEYGSLTLRPHYHVLFFGQDFLGGAEHFGSYYLNPLVDEAWGQGFVTIAPAEHDSIFYTTGYALKNLDKPDVFQVCSRRPYVGRGWLQQYYDDIARNGFVTIGGQVMRVPASYLRRPELAFEFEELKETRREYVEGLTDEERWQKRAGARSKEINLIAAGKAARGTI